MPVICPDLADTFCTSQCLNLTNMPFCSKILTFSGTSYFPAIRHTPFVRSFLIYVILRGFYATNKYIFCTWCVRPAHIGQKFSAKYVQWGAIKTAEDELKQQGPQCRFECIKGHYVYFIAPSTVLNKVSCPRLFCKNCSHFILKLFQPNSFGEVCFL